MTHPIRPKDRRNQTGDSIDLYRKIGSMEPLLPDSRRKELAELTDLILRKSGELIGSVPSEVNRKHLAALVREMNSYYSNLIEGHKTLPVDIEKALRKEYSDNSTEKANQHLSRAHIEVECLMTRRLADEPRLSVHSEEFICWLHDEFYSRLPEELHFSQTKEGKKYRIIPGELRGFEVEVQKHQPPAAAAVPQFMERFHEFYGSERIYATNQLVALAAAHHRLAWIHPFGDGNGRVARLQSHAALMRSGVNGLGLWTLSRGLARQRPAYYEHLASADARRRHDTDGRGNLSDAALADFCHFFLEVILDQIEFMMSLLQLSSLRTRMSRSLQLDHPDLKPRELERLERVMHEALVVGEIPRGRVHEIIGLSESASRPTIQLALERSLMSSSSEKGPIFLNFAAINLESWFPKLYLPLDSEIGK